MHTKSLPDGRVPVLLSAHSEELIADDAKAIVRYLDRAPDVHAVAAMLVRTRKQRRHRAIVRAADTRELADGLRALAAGEEHPLVARSSESAAARTAFVFPGQGNQWPSMGADAYRQLPVYRAEVDKCAAAFVAAGVDSPLTYLLGDAESGEGSRIQIQAAQFTHAAGLAQVWRAYGIVPEFTVGHSLGEVAAAYIAGSITVADAAAVVIARAKVVDELPGRYGMTVLGVCPADAEQLIAKASGWLELSVVNCDSSVVVSGDRDAIATIVAAAEQQGLFARDIAVDFPAHTSALDALHSALLALLPQGQFARRRRAIHRLGHRGRGGGRHGLRRLLVSEPAQHGPLRPRRRGRPASRGAAHSSSSPHIRHCFSHSATSRAMAPMSRALRSVPAAATSRSSMCCPPTSLPPQLLTQATAGPTSSTSSDRCCVISPMRRCAPNTCGPHQNRCRRCRA